MKASWPKFDSAKCRFELNTRVTRMEMKMILSRRFGVTQILFGAAIVFALLLVREAKAQEQEHTHLVTDWSHRHVMFSEPHSLMQRYQLSTVTTSPALSFDGTQVAFVQNAGTSVNLVILRWKANDGTPLAPSVPTTGACTALTAPCMQIVPFSTVNTDPALADNKSSPFYDYAQDALYVGDSSGFLHKFTGVFLGTPTEVVSASPSAVAVWPVNLTGGYGLLNSPILVGPPYNEVLVTDNSGLIY